MLVEAASDTTASYLQTVILAMVNFPDQQRTAQEEIDRVIGSERAPVITDIEELPYVQALMKEVHQFHATSIIF